MGQTILRCYYFKMFKRSVAFLLLISLISTNLSRFFVCAGFELNRTYIATKLCENRNKPGMHCNGHCYFMKKMRQAEESEKKQDAKDNLSRPEISVFQQTFQPRIQEPLPLLRQEDFLPDINCFYTNQAADSLLKPPRFS
jgi:hypothetical protein